MTSPATERLNKYLALQLGISRREADVYIEQGKVTVDSKRAVLGARITSDQIVAVGGKPLQTKTLYRYIAFHKPPGYVCSRKAQGDNPTIYSLLPSEFSVLKPVGRLDKDSSGILLLTNDGDFAHRMTHPSFRKVKQYTVAIKPALEPLHQQMIADYGVEIGDGVSKLQLERLDESRTTWQVTMHEGRNRQIRRTFASLGYEVTKLHRTVFGPFTVGSLTSGNYTEVQI